MAGILVPLDGSVRAERAIPWADRFAAALEAPVEIIRVIGPDDVPNDVNGDGVYSEAMNSESSAGRAALSLEAAMFQQVRPSRQRVMYGEVGTTIAARAHAGAADLVVMSSHGRTELQRALLGSVADQVIRESRVPVLVIRDTVPTPPAQLPKRVLVPMDGSELGAAVLSYVIPFAQKLGWELVLFWQVDLPPQLLPVQGALIPLDLPGQSDQPEMVEYLDGVAAELREKGIRAEPRVWFGPRAQSLVDVVAQENLDLIALSTHGRQGLGRWLRGSVADYVINHASVPVLVVRPPQVPMGSALARYLAQHDSAADHDSVTVTLTARQARATRLALQHLAWAAEDDDRILEDSRGALHELDGAAKQVEMDLLYSGPAEEEEPMAMLK